MEFETISKLLTRTTKSNPFQARLIIETRISHMEALEIISGSVYIWQVTQHGHKKIASFVRE